MIKYKYSIDDNDFTEFESTWAFHPMHNSGRTYIAEDAAHHLFEEANDQWPVKMTIKTMKNKLVGIFNVELIYTPQFTARETK